MGLLVVALGPLLGPLGVLVGVLGHSLGALSRSCKVLVLLVVTHGPLLVTLGQSWGAFGRLLLVAHFSRTPHTHALGALKREHAHNLTSCERKAEAESYLNRFEQTESRFPSFI